METAPLRRCTRCQVEKPADAFFKRKTSADGLHKICKECLRASNREYHQKNRDQLLEKKRKRHQVNKELEAARHREWWKENREDQLSKNRARRLTIKLAVMAHYGPGCACCGEYDSRLLSIEHSNGDGATHRREVLGTRTGGAAIYRWLVDQGFPDDLGLIVLCLSCNHASHTNGGPCPHADPEPGYLVSADRQIIENRIAWLEHQLEIERNRHASAVAAGA